MTRLSARSALPPAIAIAMAVAAAACVSNPCDNGESDRCDGDVLWTCRGERHGHAVDYSWAIEEDCSESELVCVSVEGTPEWGATALCAESSQPSPECADLLPSGSFCDGDVFVSCSRGYVTSRRPCRSCEDDVCTP